MPGSDFLKEIIKTTGNEYASLANDGIESGDVSDFIDTGSYILMLFFQVHYMVDFHKTKLQH